MSLEIGSPDRSDELGVAAGDSNTDGAQSNCVAYVMSRFPKLTETFVLDEILELERRGIRVEVFPLWRERAGVVHKDARPIVDRAHFLPTLSLRILKDNAAQFLRDPLNYVATLAALVLGNFRSLRFLAGALAIFPKATSIALRVRGLGVDHVHAHFASHPAAAAFVIGRFSGVPWSFTAHGSDLHREQAMLREKVEEASFVVAISEYNREFILERMGIPSSDKIRVIHCGVDANSFEPCASRDPSTELEIACVGTLHEVKGQCFLIEACAGLTRRGIRWKLHLVGDGPDRSDLEELARGLGVLERVVFHGGCQRHEVRDLLAKVDIASAPSVSTSDGRREGIPVALMEAGACGLPVVASRLSGIPELVLDGETGVLVEPGDVKGLEDALATLANQPETRARFGRAARARIETDFSLAVSVDRLRGEFFQGVSA